MSSTLFPIAWTLSFVIFQENMAGLPVIGNRGRKPATSLV